MKSFRAPRTTPSPERLLAAKDAIAIATIVHRPGGLRIDWKRLSDEEQTELCDLVDAAWEDGGHTPERLGPRRERYELLIERGAGQKPGSVFAQTRGLAELRKLGDDYRRETLAPPRRIRLEEAGSVTLKQRWAFDYFRTRVLFPSHVAVLVYVMSTFENGALPFPNPAATFDGETITVDLVRGGLLPDPDGVFVDEVRLIEHLAANSFIELNHDGRVLAIRPGIRLKAVRMAA